MKTFRDIIEFVATDHHFSIISCNCSNSCANCSKLEWCYVDSDLLALDYLYRGEYYG